MNGEEELLSLADLKDILVDTLKKSLFTITIDDNKRFYEFKREVINSDIKYNIIQATDVSNRVKFD